MRSPWSDSSLVASMQQTPCSCGHGPRVGCIHLFLSPCHWERTLAPLPPLRDLGLAQHLFLPFSCRPLQRYGARQASSGTSLPALLFCTDFQMATTPRVVPPQWDIRTMVWTASELHAPQPTASKTLNTQIINYLHYGPWMVMAHQGSPNEEL